MTILKKAVQDPEFAFAWDNLGISYRRLNNYDKAIDAYSKSIAIQMD
jgi:cytochrome c-type biogenesis protein CcmH/NrfG